MVEVSSAAKKKTLLLLLLKPQLLLLPMLLLLLPRAKPASLSCGTALQVKGGDVQLCAGFKRGLGL